MCTWDKRNAEEAAAVLSCPVTHQLPRSSFCSPSPRNPLWKGLQWLSPVHRCTFPALPDCASALLARYLPDTIKQLRGVTTQALPFPEPLKYSRCRPLISLTCVYSIFSGHTPAQRGAWRLSWTLLLPPPPQDQKHQSSTSHVLLDFVLLVPTITRPTN